MGSRPVRPASQLSPASSRPALAPRTRPRPHTAHLCSVPMDLPFWTLRVHGVRQRVVRYD